MNFDQFYQRKQHHSGRVVEQKRDRKKAYETFGPEAHRAHNVLQNVHVCNIVNIGFIWVIYVNGMTDQANSL